MYKYIQEVVIMDKLILVVDDEAPIVDILNFNLTKSGYKVITAYDGEEGYNLAISVKKA